MERMLYQVLASKLGAIENCEKQGNDEWKEKHLDAIHELENVHFPSGAGFDVGAYLNLDESKPDRLVIETSFHHMNEGGFYDGWSEHSVIITPSLQFGFNLRITGRNRDGIKDYIAEVFSDVLSVVVN